MSILLPAALICVLVVIVMMKNINKITDKIDAQYLPQNPRLYADFAAVIQDKVKAIRDDIASDYISAGFPNKITLLQNADKAVSLEKLSDMVRELSFFTSMLSRDKDAKTIESELFAILQKLDEFLTEFVNEGDKIADEIRDELLNHYEKLKIQAM